jgi:hypothetical protein
MVGRTLVQLLVVNSRIEGAYIDMALDALNIDYPAIHPAPDRLEELGEEDIVEVIQFILARSTVAEELQGDTLLDCTVEDGSIVLDEKYGIMEQPRSYTL